MAGKGNICKACYVYIVYKGRVSDVEMVEVRSEDVFLWTG